jgi:hypothetical protein
MEQVVDDVALNLPEPRVFGGWGLGELSEQRGKSRLPKRENFGWGGLMKKAPRVSVASKHKTIRNLRHIIISRMACRVVHTGETPVPH